MSALQTNPPIAESELAERQFSNQSLTHSLAALIDLRQQVKQSHWNITGSNFIGLHLLFDKFAEELDEIIDAAAERQRALGADVLGSIQQTHKLTPLIEFPEGLTCSNEVLNHLIANYRITATDVLAAIDPMTRDGDIGTADLFTDCIRLLDQHLYLMASHLPR